LRVLARAAQVIGEFDVHYGRNSTQLIAPGRTSTVRSTRLPSITTNRCSVPAGTSEIANCSPYSGCGRLRGPYVSAYANGVSRGTGLTMPYTRACGIGFPVASTTVPAISPVPGSGVIQSSGL